MAIRNITSWRRRLSNNVRISAVWARFRCIRMVAIICGCLSRIRSAAFCGFIKLSVLISLAVSRVSRIFFSRLAVRFLFRVLINIERR